MPRKRADPRSRNGLVLQKRRAAAVGLSRFTIGAGARQTGTTKYQIRLDFGRPYHRWSPDASMGSPLFGGFSFSGRIFGRATRLLQSHRHSRASPFLLGYFHLERDTSAERHPAVLRVWRMECTEQGWTWAPAI